MRVDAEAGERELGHVGAPDMIAPAARKRATIGASCSPAAHIVEDRGTGAGRAPATSKRSLIDTGNPASGEAT